MFTSDPERALARLRAAAGSGELDELCARRGVRLLVAFGSAVRAPGPAGDLDVAVAFGPGAGRDVLGLTNDLIALTGTVAVDLLVLDNVGPVARERAGRHTAAVREPGRGVRQRTDRCDARAHGHRVAAPAGPGGHGGVIPRRLDAAELAPSAGLRNLLVHEYASIDLERVAAAVPLAVRGYRRYLAEVARFLTS